MPGQITPSGPSDTERQVHHTPAVRAVYTAFDADPGTGKLAPHNQQMLLSACEAAGIELGTYNRRMLGWLAGWESATCAVIASLITRAAGGPARSVGPRVSAHTARIDAGG